jgi:hypothetical protein
VQVLFSDQSPIPGDRLLRAVQRFDLTPIPSTVELIVRTDNDIGERLSPDALVFAGSTRDRYRVLKVRRAPTEWTQRAGEGAEVREVIAVLEPFRALAWPLARAVFKEGRSLGECLRACGATMRMAEDIPVVRFGVMAGDFATGHVARVLQEEGAAIVWRSNGQAAAMRLADLFTGAPADSMAADTTVRVESSFLERQEIPWAMSTAPDGSVLIGRTDPPRPFVFVPRSTSRVLNNLTRCLVVRRTVQSQFAGHLRAGDGINVAGARYVITTAAHVWAAGADGNAPEQTTRLWLSDLHR